MLYPIFLNLKNKTAMVIGGGEVAHRKIKGLLKTGAKVICIAPKILIGIKRQKAVKILAKKFSLDDLKKYKPSVLINASGDKNIDALVSQAVKKLELLYNSVDNPSACNFYVPAVINKKKLTIAVSTEGAAPFMAAYIKKSLAKAMDQNWPAAIEAVSRQRKKLKASSLTSKEKMEIYKKILREYNLE